MKSTGDVSLRKSIKDKVQMNNGIIVCLGDIITTEFYDQHRPAVVTHFDFSNHYQVRVKYIDKNSDTNGFSLSAKFLIKKSSNKLIRLLI